MLGFEGKRGEGKRGSDGYSSSVTDLGYSQSCMRGVWPPSLPSSSKSKGSVYVQSIRDAGGMVRGGIPSGIGSVF